MNFRPYHNPEKIDESLVPDGWRFRYADEMDGIVEGPCIQWNHVDWSHYRMFMGTNSRKTYIVPVNS